jgi:hypothetical protein
MPFRNSLRTTIGRSGITDAFKHTSCSDYGYNSQSSVGLSNWFPFSVLSAKLRFATAICAVFTYGGRVLGVRVRTVAMLFRRVLTLLKVVMAGISSRRSTDRNSCAGKLCRGWDSALLFLIW